MQSSSIPAAWYADQAALAAQELDFDLHIAACEAELKDVISATFDPMPSAESDNSVYNLNEILDALD